MENKWIQSSAAVKQVYSEMIGIQIVRPRFRKYFQNIKIAWNEPIYLNKALKNTYNLRPGQMIHLSSWKWAVLTFLNWP